MTPFEFSNGQFDCSAENFFMGAYGLLLARFAGADEVFFTATSDKKIPVYLNISPEQKLADYLKNLREQIERSREIICTPYEEIAKAYDFPTAPEFISAPQEISGKSFALAVAENILSIYYDSGKYSDELIKSFAAAYKHLVAQFPHAEKIGDIDWLSSDELAKVQAIHDTAWEVMKRPAYRLLNRGLEVYIARQGILKTGGAFLPMTPD